jgi:hypothetical protein
VSLLGVPLFPARSVFSSGLVRSESSQVLTYRSASSANCFRRDASSAAIHIASSTSPPSFHSGSRGSVVCRLFLMPLFKTLKVFHWFRFHDSDVTVQRACGQITASRGEVASKARSVGPVRRRTLTWSSASYSNGGGSSNTQPSGSMTSRWRGPGASRSAAS